MLIPSIDCNDFRIISFDSQFKKKKIITDDIILT